MGIELLVGWQRLVGLVIVLVVFVWAILVLSQATDP